MYQLYLFYKLTRFKHELRKKCPYLEFSWSAFSLIRTEYGDLQSTGKGGPEKLRIRTVFAQGWKQVINPCDGIDLFLYPLNTSEN